MKSKLSLCLPILLGWLLLLAGCHETPTPGLELSLTGTVWKVVELDGQMVATETIPTLQLEPSGNRVIGFGGVNRVVGTYRLDGATLYFGPLVATRMAGPARQMNVEAKFLQLLGTVTGCRATGQWLVLLAGDKVVARAQATPAVPYALPEK